MAALVGVGGELAIIPPGPRPLPHRAVDRLCAGHSGAKRHSKGPVLEGSEALAGAMRHGVVLATCPWMRLRGEQTRVSWKGRRMRCWSVSMAFLQEPSQLLTSNPPRDAPCSDLTQVGARTPLGQPSGPRAGGPSSWLLTSELPLN